MTDKKMLKLAAQSVNSILGYEALKYMRGLGWIEVKKDGTHGCWWNPLTDSSAAFELAVTLGNTASSYETFKQLKAMHKNPFECDIKAHFAAARRAVVRRAALQQAYVVGEL